MNQKIKINQGIKMIIGAAAVLLVLLIWPAGVIHRTEISKSDEVILQESEPISVEHNGTQMFIAQGSYLEAVDLYVANDMAGEIITFRVYDSAYSQLWETFYTVEENAVFPGFIHIKVGLETEEGWEYYYTVEGLTSDLVLACEDTWEADSFANGTFVYGGEEMPGINLIARYQYREDLPWWLDVVLGLLILGIAVLLARLTDRLFAGVWAGKNKEIRVQQLIQWIANPVLTVVTLAALIAVFPGRKFGTGIVNYGFYDLGILLTAAVLFFGINYKRQGSELLMSREIFARKWPQWAMAVCFAGVLWSCYEYMNGLYDIYHEYAACKLIIWFGLAFLCTLKKRDVLKLWNLIYLVIACICGYFYAKPWVGVEEQEELYKLAAGVGIIAGLVILQIVVSLIRLLRKQERSTAKVNLPLFGTLVLLLALMVFFANTRSWPILVAVLFGCFYYRMWLWDERDGLMEIFTNGIILNFIYTVGYCLVHRPYHRYRFNRYGLVFHTVTVTGYYLALVLCGVTVSLVVRYRKTGRWRDCWKQLSLLGMGNVYLFLTLSRTGYLAAYAMELFICVFVSCVWEKKKLAGMMKSLAAGIGVSLVFFPIVFTTQRILPAVFDDPVYSELEIWDYTIEKGESSDSQLYMDVEYFLRLAVYKLFDVEIPGQAQGIYRDGPGETLLAYRLENLDKPVYAAGISSALVSDTDMDSDYDLSNGRLEIFREYIGKWNLTGHDEMGFTFPDGSVSVHAHNTYLQVIHDHGLITGAVFLIFGIMSFGYALVHYCKRKEKQPYLLLTVAVITAFALAGMVEWIFHPCNPFGFAIFIVITPLLFETKGTQNKSLFPEKAE